MKSNFFYLILLTLFLSKAVSAQSESDFYKETIDKYKTSKNLKADYGVNGKGSASDSERLQKAINEVSKAGGGKIVIPAGNYLFSRVELKSNVHLLIDKNAVIAPLIENPAKSVAMFVFDDDIQNVSVRGQGGRFTVNLPKHKPGIFVFHFHRVNNFLLSDFVVNDQLTKFSAVGYGISKGADGKYDRPKNGVLKNADIKNAHYGYGLVQIQAGENLFFKDISGTGGVTLRVETGWTFMNDLQVGGTDNIVGRNISCTNGNAGVMISPHSMHNGPVDIDGVKTVNCGFGVRVDNGFISKKYTNKNITAGTFSKVTVKNVESTFGETAQIKEKHYKYIPVYREKFITKTSYDGNESFIGPAIAAVLNDVETYKENVTISNVKAHGFLCQKPIVTGADTHSTMDCEP